jgi:lysophospholipase
MQVYREINSPAALKTDPESEMDERKAPARLENCRLKRRRDSSLSLMAAAGQYLDPAYQPKVLLPCPPRPPPQSSQPPPDPHNESRILVLYSGGTIGMKVENGAYSPAPGFLGQEISRLPMFHDPDYCTFNVNGDEEQLLAMPVSKDGKRVLYSMREYDPLLDSSNMTMTDWARLAHDIKKSYDCFDGFVILHGTDTMAYTASALSFILENLGKPVILTGSQIPIFETRSDGRDNFLGALIMAGHYCIPEVSVYFNNKLMRGNRCMKIDAGSFDAFHSPNLRPLAELEIDITVHWDAVFRPPGTNKFEISTDLCPNVGLLRLFPSITTATVEAFLQPPLEGMVLQSYGAGNGPSSRQDLLDVFREATERGVIIVNITQCSRGHVSPLYQAGKAFFDVGVIAGFDMTPEAALAKLAYILGKKEWTLEMKRERMKTNLRGEVKVVAAKVEVQNQTLLELPLLERMKEMMSLSSEEEVKVLKDAVYPSLLCAAAKKGDLEAIKTLKNSGAVLSATDYDGRGVLHVAASEGHLDVVKFLLNYGCSVHERDRWGDSPLDDAIRFNHHDIIRLLVKTGAHLTLPPFKLGTYLCLAAFHHDLEGLKSWILAGGSVNGGDYDTKTCIRVVNQGDYNGRTALHVAAAQDDEELVTYLLSIGAKPNIEDSFGLTPLDEARKHGFTHIVELIEESNDCPLINEP